MDVIEGKGTEKIRALMKYSRENMMTEENLQKISTDVEKARAAFHALF